MSSNSDSDGAQLTSLAFNQVQLEYNASKDEKLDKLKEVMDAREKKYRVAT